jgi:site-specific recombinase XerD
LSGLCPQAGSIENDNTRMAYYRAVCSFFAWLEQHGIGGLVDIEPFHVAAYIKALKVSDAGNPAVKERATSRPTVKQHLSAIRMLFDWLIVGQALAINPAHAVRGPKHVVKRGKTPVLTEEQARRLLESIGCCPRSCPRWVRWDQRVRVLRFESGPGSQQDQSVRTPYRWIPTRA